MKNKQWNNDAAVGTFVRGSFVETRRPGLVRAIKFIAGPLLSMRFRLEVEGQERLPKESAFALLPKHQRWEDIALLALATPRSLYYMAKIELFSNPIFGWFIFSLGGVPVNRARPLASRRFFRHMIACLSKGEGMVIFPEGTYYRNVVGPGHPGLIRAIHSRFDIPFIPTGIHYAEGMGRKRVKIRFGNPLLGKHFSNTRELLDRVMVDIARLSELKGDKEN